MYQTDFYRCNDSEKIGLFVRSYPLALLMPAENGSGHFVHLPLIVAEWTPARRALFGHIDNENPFLERLKVGNPAVYAIFQGPNAYVSPSDYVSKQLPTWNYSVVHISGKIALVTDEIEKLCRMEDMARSLERDWGRDFALDREDSHIRHLIAMITFFEIEVTTMEAVFKFSQDKRREDMLAAKCGLLRKIHETNKSVLSKIVE